MKIAIAVTKYSIFMRVKLDTVKTITVVLIKNSR